MSIGLLDLSDCNVQLWHGDKHVQSPGYALLDKHEYVFGQAARRAARLRPREVNTRFWWHLGTEPLQPPLGHARHTGDLAHAHLNALHAEAGKPGEILFAVPSTMGREQLSLLLGIAQQCPFDAVGLVNRSVALGSLHGTLDRQLHLELQLHQAALTVLEREGDNVVLGGHQVLPGCGLLQLQERLVEAVASAFVRQSRFDPRRRAQTEQQLYDELPALLRQLEQSEESSIEINGYQARVSRTDLSACSERLLQDTVKALTSAAADSSLLLVDPLLALLPGVNARFAREVEQLRVAGTDSVRQALEAQSRSIIQRGEALDFVTALPCQTVTDDSVPKTVTPVNAAVVPTHLLRGHSATPLDSTGTTLEDGWSLRQSGKLWLLEGAPGKNGTTPTVNGQNYVAGQALSAGDEIRIGDSFIAQLIEVGPQAQ